MSTFINKTVPLSDIAAYVNNPDTDPDILAFEEDMAHANLKNLSIRIDALVLMICKRGNAKISIDLKEHDLSPDTFVIIRPHNYVAIYDCSPDLKLQLVVCSLRMVENILPKMSDLMPVVVLNSTSPVLKLTSEQSEWLQGLFRLVIRKLEAGATRFLMPKLQKILQAVLYEVLDIYLAANPQTKTMSSRKEELMARFILAVVEECTRHRKVDYYADKLCITSKHLSAVVKELSGQTAGTIIDRYVVLEAKILLKNTDLTIQEVSASLNFPNQSFFGKYFKHATGMSPSEFRAQISGAG